jgi:hypothetical protein
MWVCLNCEASEKGVGVKKATRDLCTYCVASLQRTGRAWCRKGKHVVASIGRKPQWCAACRSDANREYRKANHARELARVKAWKQAHPGRPRKRKAVRLTPEQLARRRQWYAETKEERAERQNSYRLKRASLNPSYWKERRHRGKVNMFRRLLQP